jgi:hypothetical protein
MTATRMAVSMMTALLLTGCGAILHGPRQNIEVQTSPGGAKVETSPPTGIFTTPTTLNLERRNNYTLTFTSPGYNPATFYIHNGIGPGTVILDVVLTGLIGIAVDGFTGSWYGLEPESATVTLTRATTGGDGPEEIHIELKQSDRGRHVSLKSDAQAPNVSVRVERR